MKAKLYILDEDPVKAARSLIQIHIIRYIKNLQYTFVKAHNRNKFRKNNDHIFKIVYYSKENYIWFSEFYKELKRIINYEPDCVPEFNESLLFDISNMSFKGTGLMFSEENDVSTTILKHRAKYIKKNYDKKLFLCSFPEWYVCLNEELFNRYDNKSGKGLKITINKDGSYNYFVSNYFNKWIELEKVPKEIDYFINYLLVQSTK